MKIIIFTLSFFLFLSSYSIGNSSLKFVTVNFPPYSYIEDNTQKIKGIQVEIVEKMCQLSKIKCNFELMPFPRAFREVQKKDDNKFLIDAIFNFYINPERLKIFEYSVKILDNPLVIFVRTDSNIKYNGDIIDLKGLIIGLMNGYTYSDELDSRRERNEKGFYFELSNDYETLFKKLEANRIDLIIAEKNVGKYIARRLSLEKKVKILPKVFRFRTGHIAISKENEKKKLLKSLNQSYEILKRNGIINKIFTKYKY